MYTKIAFYFFLVKQKLSEGSQRFCGLCLNSKCPLLSKMCTAEKEKIWQLWNQNLDSERQMEKNQER